VQAMGNIKEHPPVKLFTGITYTPDINLSGVFSVLEDSFSKIEQVSNSYNFSRFTQYYEKEMGKELQKVFVVFSVLVKPEILPDIKARTNKMEQNYLLNGMRKLNLDPGYISEAKVVLATTKNYSHRIYLRAGIFADIHLSFMNHKFQVQPWTYPDYRQQEIMEFFNEIRQKYLNQLGDLYLKT
jgi:hypothetical protein